MGSTNWYNDVTNQYEMGVGSQKMAQWTQSKSGGFVCQPVDNRVL